MRAIDEKEGRVSESADAEFQILPPIWARPWFVALVIAIVTGTALLLHRIRIRQILALETVRRQIAGELHDEVGADLSQIAVLSEVARREASPRTAPLLDRAAGLARSMRESMRDIVWAIDPRNDRVADLAALIQQVAYYSLATDGLHVDVGLPPERDLARVTLSLDRRQHILRIFKEAITNIARRAHATKARIDLRLTSGWSWAMMGLGSTRRRTQAATGSPA